MTDLTDQVPMPIKVFELAKEFELNALDTSEKLKAAGFHSVRNHMTALSDEEAVLARKILKGEFKSNETLTEWINAFNPPKEEPVADSSEPIKRVLDQNLIVHSFIGREIFHEMGPYLGDLGELFDFLGNRKNEKRKIVKLKDDRYGLVMPVDYTEKMLVFAFEGRLKNKIDFIDVLDPVSGDFLEGAVQFQKSPRSHQSSEFYGELQRLSGGNEANTNDAAFNKFLEFSKDYMLEEEAKLKKDEESWQKLIITDVVFKSTRFCKVKFNRTLRESEYARAEFKLFSPSGTPDDGVQYKITNVDKDLYTLQTIDNDEVPELTQGFTLVPEYNRQRIELQRKMRAYNQLVEFPERYKDIWDIILTPEQLRKVEEEPEDVQFYTNKDLSPDTKTAIRNILKGEQIHMIQGPPGTGKTTLITELCAQLIEKGKNIIVASQGNLAVDNVIEKLQKVSSEYSSKANMVRLGRDDSVKINEAEKLLPRKKSLELVDKVKATCSRRLNMFKKLEGRPIPSDIKNVYKEINSLELMINSKEEEKNNLSSHIIRTQEFIDEFENTRMPKSIFLMTKYFFKKRFPLESYKSLRALYTDQEVQSLIMNREDDVSLKNVADLLSDESSMISDEIYAKHTQVEGTLQYIQLVEDHFGAEDILNYVKYYTPEDFSQLMHDINQLRSLIPQLEQDQESLKHVNEFLLSKMNRKIELEEFTSSFSEFDTKDMYPLINIEGFDQFIPQYLEMLKELDNDIKSDSYRLEDYIIKSSNVVFSTCSMLAGKAMNSSNKIFDIAIIDEASKGQISDLLIPMMMSKRFVLVGDHFQLPPTIKEMKYQKVLKKSFFERIFNQLPEHFKKRLNHQYRMPPQVSSAISSVFYDGDLQDSERILSTDYSGYEAGNAFKWIKVDGEVEGATSVYNLQEIETTVKLLKELVKKYPEDSIGVISAYKRHHELMEEALANEAELQGKKIESGTIDEFQGRQKSIIIINTVRNGFKLKHMSDRQRINVAFSRCENLLFLVGSSNLEHDPTFQELIQELQKKKVKNVA